MSLLKKIEDSYLNKPYFSTFCLKYGFNHAGIYTLENNNFFLEKSFGLDAETIFKSISTRDFWKGTLNYFIDNDFWISFSRKEDNLEPFFQFFSRDTVDSLNSIYFYIFKTRKETSIFFFINCEEDFILPEISDSFTNELLSFVDEKTNFYYKKIDFLNFSNENFVPVEINFSELFNYYLDKIKYFSNDIQNHLMNTFYEQFYLNIEKLLPANSFLIPYSNEKINVILPKRGLLNRISMLSDLNKELKMYCSASVYSAVKIYFYSFDAIDMNDFVRSKF